MRNMIMASFSILFRNYQPQIGKAKQCHNQDSQTAPQGHQAIGPVIFFNRISMHHSEIDIGNNRR